MKTSSRPKVSVIMPVYNAAPYLKAAMDSVINQSYKPSEIIIVNDASTDQSKQILTYYKRKHPELLTIVTFAKQTGYGGEVAANYAISRAKGDYIAKMDADDISHKDRFRKQVDFLEKNPDVFLVGTQTYVIDTTGNIIGQRILPIKSEDIYKSFYLRNCITHPSIMFRNQHNKAFYTIKYIHSNDYYTFFKLMSEGKKLANLPEPLLYYRINPSGTMFKSLKKSLQVDQEIRASFINDFHFQPSISDRLYITIYYLLIYYLPEKILLSLNKLKGKWS